jgi:hypothetical protein
MPEKLAANGDNSDKLFSNCKVILTVLYVSVPELFCKIPCSLLDFD